MKILGDIIRKPLLFFFFILLFYPGSLAAKNVAERQQVSKETLKNSVYSIYLYIFKDNQNRK